MSEGGLLAAFRLTRKRRPVTHGILFFTRTEEETL